MDVSMDTSMLLARLIGFVLVITTIGFLLNRRFYHQVLKDFSVHSFVTYLSGFINLILGLLVVSFHNVWEGWMGLVTFIGWVFIFSGLCRILYPKGSMKCASRLSESKRHSQVTAILVIICLVGLYLLYCGFFPGPVVKEDACCFVQKIMQVIPA